MISYINLYSPINMVDATDIMTDIYEICVLN